MHWLVNVIAIHPLIALHNGEEIQVYNMQRKHPPKLEIFSKEIKQVFIDMFSNLAYMAP